MNDKMKPAIIGGVVLGLLSAIPFVNIPNVCCCSWAIVGGALASYLYIKNSATPVKPGDGAMLGVIAGVVGAVIYIILGIPMALLVGNTMASIFTNMMGSMNPEQAEVVRQQMEASQSVGNAIISGIIGAVFLVIFSTLGGLVAVPLFEKRKGGGSGTPPPPPPPAFGGQPQQPGAGYSSFGTGS